MGGNKGGKWSEDRILTKEEASDLFQGYEEIQEIKDLKHDLQFCQDLIASYETRCQEYKRYIQAMEQFRTQREGRIIALERTLEQLEVELLKLR